MLQSLHQGAKNPIVKFLVFGTLFLAMAGLAMLDISGFLRRSMDAPKAVVATVGDTAIATMDFERRFADEMQRLHRAYGTEFTRNQAIGMGMHTQILSRMVDEALLDSAALEAGFATTDAMVAKAIRADKTFADEQGNFSSARFTQLLGNAGMSEDGFADLLRRDLPRSALVRSVSAGAIAPQGLVDAYFLATRQRRVPQTILLTDISAPGVTDPSGEAIGKRYDEHPDDYMAPEYRSLRIFEITADDFMDDAEPAEEDLKAYYADHEGDIYYEREQRIAVQAVLDGEAKAESVAEAVRGGVDMAKAVEAAGGNAAQVLDMGWLPSDRFAPETREIAFSMEKGAVSDPIAVGQNWVVMQLKDIKPPRQIPFGDVRDSIVDAVRHEKAADALYDAANSIDDELGSGKRLEDIAREMKISLRDVDAVDSAGKLADATPLPGLATLRGALASAFATEAGKNTGLVESDSNTFAAIEVRAITPSARLPLEKVRDEIAHSLRREALAAANAARADKALEAIRAGKSMTDVAAGYGASAETGLPMTADAATTLPQEAVATLFDLKKVGDADVVEVRNGRMLVLLSGILPADIGEDAEGLASIRDQIARGFGDNLVSAFVDDLRALYPVEIDQHTVDRVFPPEVPEDSGEE